MLFRVVEAAFVWGAAFKSEQSKAGDLGLQQTEEEHAIPLHRQLAEHQWVNKKHS
jgi:hypothetical protein